MENTAKKYLYLLFIALFFAMFIKAAWVCDDAYINFRSIEQLHAGNGPIWNPHERVQVYTSPLWYWTIAFFSYLISDYFLCMLIVSFILFFLLAYFINDFADSRKTTLFLILMAVGTRTFYDFSSSGLEPILASFITAYTFIQIFKFSRSQNNNFEAEKHYKNALFGFAMATICRHDLITLLGIPVLFMVYKNNSRTVRQRLADLLLAAVPLIVWTLFATIYYGMPLPNTAYAKLHTGISKLLLCHQGFYYVIKSLWREPVIAFLFFLPAIINLRKKNAFVSAAILGIIVNVLYVISVGGDFMVGRFLLSDIIAAVIIFVEMKVVEDLIAKTRTRAIVIYSILIAYALFFPFTTLNLPYQFEIRKNDNGIADERLYYFRESSLHAWYINLDNYLSDEDTKPFFPHTDFALIGHYLRENKPEVYKHEVIGFLGYWAGTEVKIVDQLALSDPFLARHPIATPDRFRIGHFFRKASAEYLNSVKTGKNCLTDPKERELYDLIRLATQEKVLFSKERFNAIFKLAFM